MATTTPNFGWSVPTSTDLVKDGATAIETLGDSIDASLVDLKGGTSGQVLKKNSNTDMDFVWGADSAGMTNPMTTTGDMIYSSSGSTPARLGIGSSGQVVTVAAGVPVWATPSSGGMTLLSTTTLSGASVTISDIPQTYIDLVMYLVNYKPSADTDYPLVQFNSDATANRYANKIGNYTTNQTFGSDSFPLMQEGGNDNSVATGLNWTRIPYYANTTTWKMANTMDFAVNGTTTTNYNQSFAYSFYNQTTAISSLKILANSGTMTSGTIYLYGVK